ncbi:hypothetical protein SAMN04488564_1011004 [Lentzea waywayandensis]|uniref:Peptidase family M23 n=1 Tax=Lentzea waywayandensis TaxID=84724 RepID=A0A1I6D3N3_9PSEU|nr:hypothetical protein SAMN04488564_1011004 [Lentzea waywayandensis]
MNNRGQSTGPHLHFEVQAGGSQKINAFVARHARRASVMLTGATSGFTTYQRFQKRVHPRHRRVAGGTRLAPRVVVDTLAPGAASENPRAVRPPQAVLSAQVKSSCTIRLIASWCGPGCWPSRRGPVSPHRVLKVNMRLPAEDDDTPRKPGAEHSYPAKTWPSLVISHSSSSDHVVTVVNPRHAESSSDSDQTRTPDAGNLAIRQAFGWKIGHVVLRVSRWRTRTQGAATRLPTTAPKC